jgi:fibronectin type 3 domain-containing protein
LPATRHVAVLVAILSTFAVFPAALLSTAGASDAVTVWTEGFEGDPASRGVVTVQDAPLPSDGAVTAWNLIDTSKATNQLTWDGVYEGTNFYYVGLDKTTDVASGLAYGNDADTSLILTAKPVPNDAHPTQATLSFALAGASEDGFDFLDVDVKAHDAPDGAYQTLTAISGQGHTLWTTSGGAPLASAIVSVDVSSYIGQTVDVRFRFTSDSITADGQQDPGWCIDDVQLTESGLATHPSAPTGLAATSTNKTQIDLAWSAPVTDGGSPITSYTVYRGPSGGSLVAIGTSTTTSYADTTVAKGRTYDYAVTATNAYGEGPRSNLAEARAGRETPPHAPTGLTATLAQGAVHLAWLAPLNDGGSVITGYDVLRGPDAGNLTLLASIGATTSYDDAQIASGATYAYAVSAVNALGVGPASNVATATFVAPPTFKAYEDPDGATRTEQIGSQPAGCCFLATAGEPSVGVDQKTGDVLLQVDRLTLLLRPDGATGEWRDVSDPTQVSLPVSDPIGWLDPATGRYFGGTIMGDCSQLAFTDDDGGNWTPTTGACDSFNGHDHETVGGGPFPPGIPNPGVYPDIVWYCAQDNVVAKCAPSVDGGLTFLPAQPIWHDDLNLLGDEQCGGIHGHVRVAPNGTVVVPNKACGVNLDHKGGAISYDGLTWHVFTIPGTSVRSTAEFDPSAAFGKDGTLYYGMCDGDSHPKVAVSKDGAATWSAPVDVGTTFGIQNCEFAETIAGDAGRAAFAFLGTTTPGNDQDSSFAGVWHLYVSFTYDAGATWTTVDATPNDPVQRGCISAAGTLGGACSQRNLLDFNDIALDGQGNVVVGYADGCVGACVTDPSAPSTSAIGAVAIQASGECLFVDKCAHALQPPLPPPAGLPIPTIVPNADTCNPNLVIFSSNSAGTPSLNAHALICLAEGFGVPSPVDTAFINPGSDRISLRYTVDQSVPALVGTVQGLGADGGPVSLTRNVDATTGSVTYDSPAIAIDPTQSGSITAVVTLPDGTPIPNGVVTFHTIT